MDLIDKTQRTILGYKLESQTNDEIDLDLLKAYIEATEKHGNTTLNVRYQALKLKYEAMTTVPTIIEKTMSPAQLYASSSPLWANGYKGLTIERILEKLNGKPQTEESFNKALASVLGSKNKGQIMFDEYRNIGGIHGNLLQVGLGQEHEPQKIQQ